MATVSGRIRPIVVYVARPHERSKEPLMSLTAQQFADYLRNNEGKEYSVEGTSFFFSLHDPREDDFPCSIRFSSSQWKKG